MDKKEKILEAINEVREILKNVPEPDKSLSFPVILKKVIDSSSLEQDPTLETTKKTIEPDDFSGLTGGIKLLFKEGFFGQERTQGDIYQELRRQGYHYPATSLTIALLRQRKIITRILGIDKRWRYIERK
jgi:hypothetical protein